MPRISKLAGAGNGQSRGIGAGIAKRFAAEGAAVAVASNEDFVHTVADSLREYGGAVSSHVVDVTDIAQVGALYDAVVREHGRMTFRFRTRASSR